jgi:beta-glucosidase
MGWEVYPEGLYRLLVRIRDDYAPPAIYVTENGAAYTDLLDHEGQVRDHERKAFLAEYVAAVGRAVADGVPVAGYFVWSLLDNFEWSHGYAKRFGIVYVDYPTLRRIPKLSAHWYRDLIAARRAALPAAEAG